MPLASRSPASSSTGTARSCDVDLPTGEPAGSVRAVSETIGLGEAAEILQVTPDRVRALVEQGLLDPVDGDRFDPAQVRAVHDLGG